MAFWARMSNSLFAGVSGAEWDRTGEEKGRECAIRQSRYAVRPFIEVRYDLWRSSLVTGPTEQRFSRLLLYIDMSTLSGPVVNQLNDFEHSVISKINMLDVKIRHNMKVFDKRKESFFRS